MAPQVKEGVKGLMPTDGQYDKIYFGNLLAYYDSFLTAKQREYVRLYYQEDYSLQEIAAIYRVSRSAIHTQIQHAQEKMLSLERHCHTRAIGEEILPLLEDGLRAKDWEAIATNIGKLKEIIRETE
jgi:hypothetical protein